MGSEEFASCKVVRGSAGVDPTNTDDAATVAAIEQPIRKPSFNRYSDEFVVLAGNFHSVTTDPELICSELPSNCGALLPEELNRVRKL